MALLGVQPWEEIGDFKFQAIAEGKNLDVVLQGWNLRDSISDEALDLLQVRERGWYRGEGEMHEVSGWSSKKPKICLSCTCSQEAFMTKYHAPCGGFQLVVLRPTRVFSRQSIEREGTSHGHQR